MVKSGTNLGIEEIVSVLFLHQRFVQFLVSEVFVAISLSCPVEQVLSGAQVVVLVDKDDSRIIVTPDLAFVLLEVIRVWLSLESLVTDQYLDPYGPLTRFLSDSHSVHWNSSIPWISGSSNISGSCLYKS